MEKMTLYFQILTPYMPAPYTFVADAGNIGNTYWNWDFGDGTFASGSNATNNYTQPGIYKYC